MYLIETIEYLMFKTKKNDFDIAYYHFEVSVHCFYKWNEMCNEMMRWISLINRLFSDINISQGSVETRLKCGANFLEIITVKEF